MNATTLDDAPGLPMPRQPVPRWAGALAGALGALMALAVGELFDGASQRIPSLVVSMGNLVIDRADAGTTKWAIELFGENDKPALVIGILVISVLIGTVAGVRGLTRSWVPGVVFAIFGVLGALVAASEPQSAVLGSWISALVSAAVGYATYRVVLWVPQHLLSSAVSFETASTVDIAESAGEGVSLVADPAPAANGVFDRRVFVGTSAGAGLGALIALGVGGRLRSRADVSAERDALADRLTSQDLVVSDDAPDVSLAPVAEIADPEEHFRGLSTHITPNDDFYRIDTAIQVPQIDPGDWQLEIRGLVDNPMTLTLDDILAMPLVEREVTIACVSNNVGGDLIGNAVWTGVPLHEVLATAGVQADADQIVGRSYDGWTAGFPTSVIDGDRSALIAIAMNGEPLPIIHGFPARLIVAGLYGYVSATKWLTSIELTRWDDFDGYWIPRGWSKEGPIKLASRIDTPRGGRSFTAGPLGIGGVAWAPTRGVGAVEVQVDDRPWMPAELHRAGAPLDPASPEASETDESWVQWTLLWDATPGTHEIRVRAYDLAGERQPEGPKPVAPDGAEGWHRVIISVA